MSGLALACGARSVVGPVRANNEDAVFASPRLAAVADGVGGAAAGEVASATAVHALAHLDKCRLRGTLGEALAAAVAQGNEAIAFIASARRAAISVARARSGDRLLLCSDGLSDVLDDAELATALRRDPPRACAERLVAPALAAGARDNVSVVVADVAPGRNPEDGWA